MAAPENFTLGPGLPNDTQYVRPLSILGHPLPLTIPISSPILSEAIGEFLRKLPLRRIDVIGFEPCTAFGEAVMVKTHIGLSIPRILYAMDFIDEVPNIGYSVSRRHPWKAPIDHSVRAEIDTVILQPHYEAPEGSRFRYTR